MIRFARILFLALAVGVGSLAASAISNSPVAAGGTAYAQSTPEGLSKLESKVNDIAQLITKILYVFVGLGILFCGFRFIQGDPHAWKYTITVVVGATIIFASGEILTWLQR
jgi:type IV secretory pathway VirB2 component (pilin)